MEGGTNRSYGIQVAKLAGVPNRVIRRAFKVLAGIEKDKNRQSAASAMFSRDEPDLKTQHVQIDMFGSPDQAVVRELQNLDLSAMTPLDALNYLNDLQKKVKSLNAN